MQWWRVSLRDLGRSGDARGGGFRVDWADTAKAVSIVLLVFWTLEGTSLHVNRMLNLARMPLFFFVSGLFAWRVVTRTDFGTFARDKVGNLVYLYLLWATLLSPRHISSLGRGGGGRSIPGRRWRCSGTPSCRCGSSTGWPSPSSWRGRAATCRWRW